MNKFQKERQNIFSQMQLSQERKEAVINKVKPVKKKSIKPAIAFLCISFIVIVLAMTSLSSSPEYSTASLLEAAYEDSVIGQSSEIMETYLNFITENDGFIVSKEGDAYTFHYALFENSEWKFIEFGVLGVVKDDFYTNWRMNEINNKTIYSGIMNKSDSKKILVGDKPPNIFDKGYSHELWFAIGNSKGTPIYIVENGIKQMILAGQPYINMEVPVVYEMVGDDYKMQFKENTMDIGYDEYNEFPIVIDPDYYLKNNYKQGDVVLVEGTNGPTVTRVITAEPTKVDIVEGTILLNEYRSTDTFLYGHINGDTTLTAQVNESYGTTQQGELFVMPDNWGSDGVRGIISKQQVLGKVLGYHLPSVKAQFSEEEITLYESYKKDSNSALIDTEPQTVARLYNFAALQKDYEIMYSLTAQNEMTIPLNQYIAEAEHGQTKITDYIHAYDAHLLSRSKLIQGSQPVLMIEDISGKPYFYFRMVKEDGIWKVGYLAKQ